MQKVIRKDFQRCLGISSYDPEHFKVYDERLSDDDIKELRRQDKDYGISTKFRFLFYKPITHEFNQSAIMHFVFQFIEKVEERKAYTGYQFPTSYLTPEFVKETIIGHIPYARNCWKRAMGITPHEKVVQRLVNAKMNGRRRTVKVSFVFPILN